MGKRTKSKRGGADPTKTWGIRKQTKSSSEERMAFVRAKWIESPDLPINGRNGIIQLMSERFGKVARYEQLADFRRKMSECGDFTPLPIRIEEVRSRQPDPKFSNPVIVDHELAMPQHDAALVPVAKVAKRNPKADGSGSSRADAAIRAEWARGYLEVNPKAPNSEIYAEMNPRFGKTTNGSTLAAIRRGMRRAATYKQPRPVVTLKPTLKPAAEPQPAPPKEPMNQRKRQQTQSPAEAIKAAVEMLLEDLPNLRRVEVLIVDGKPRVKWEVATVEMGEF